jgi:hypothetical protein
MGSSGLLRIADNSAISLISSCMLAMRRFNWPASMSMAKPCTSDHAAAMRAVCGSVNGVSRGPRCCAPTALLSTVNAAFARLVAGRGGRVSLRQVAAEMEAAGFVNANGRQYAAKSVMKMLAEPSA